jgi:hypothetical protein
MPWYPFHNPKLREILGQTYIKQHIFLDGNNYRNCSFDQCVLVYRGGPAQLLGCYVSPGCCWQFEDAASCVVQFLKGIGWKIIPPGGAEE